MKRFIALSVLALALAACSSAEKRAETQAITNAQNEGKMFEFDGNCGMGLCRKKARVPCNVDITLEYKGKNYCFSSTEARDTFVQNIDNNIKMANERWSSIGGGSK